MSGYEDEILGKYFRGIRKGQNPLLPHNWNFNAKVRKCRWKNKSLLGNGKGNRKRAIVD